MGWFCRLCSWFCCSWVCVMVVCLISWLCIWLSWLVRVLVIVVW